MLFFCLCEGINKRVGEESLSFPLQAAVCRLMSHAAAGNAKKLHTQPHRGTLQSLCAVSSFSQKTQAFLDVLSDLYQENASHKVPRRTGNTKTLRDSVLGESDWIFPLFGCGNTLISERDISVSFPSLTISA